MWCRNCNMETNENYCPVCGEETVEDLPTEIYWCKECKVPIIQSINQSDKGICPICGKKTKYLTTDLRPVFPEERLFVDVSDPLFDNKMARVLLECVKDYCINIPIGQGPSSRIVQIEVPKVQFIVYTYLEELLPHELKKLLVLVE